MFILFICLNDFSLILIFSIRGPHSYLFFLFLLTLLFKPDKSLGFVFLLVQDFQVKKKKTFREFFAC